MGLTLVIHDLSLGFPVADPKLGGLFGRAENTGRGVKAGTREGKQPTKGVTGQVTSVGIGV